MLYHASPVGGIDWLVPRVSNHGRALVYFSERVENTFVYLSNAVEKCCREGGVVHKGGYTKWGPYGFNGEGILTLDEYYPDAIKDTYKGVSGYIYMAEETEDIVPLEGIPFAFISEREVKVKGVEFVPDAYSAIMRAAEEGKIVITEYKDLSPAKLEWIDKTVKREYEEGSEEYRFFLRNKFAL